MNEILSKHTKNAFISEEIDYSEKTEGLRFLLYCIENRICPKCSQDIYSYEGVKNRKPGDPILYICLDCGWNDYV